MSNKNIFESAWVPAPPPHSSAQNNLSSSFSTLSLSPSRSPLPPPTAKVPNEAKPLIQQISDMWLVILLPILCVILFVVVREVYHRQERNDPNSMYSQRRRERERQQLRRYWMQNVINRGDAGGNSSIRSWNATWMSPARREERKKYILNNIYIEVNILHTFLLFYNCE